MKNPDEAVPDRLDARPLGQLVRTGIVNAGAVFATGFRVLPAVMFMLIEGPEIPAKLRLALGAADETDARLRQVTTSIKRYKLIKTFPPTMALINILAAHPERRAIAILLGQETQPCAPAPGPQADAKQPEEA